MKFKICIYIIFSFIVDSNILAAELRLYSVQENQIIINKDCKNTSKLKWDKELLNATDGLKNGDDLLILTPTKFKPVKAGELSCFIGECRQNYVSIKLSDSDNDVIAVVKKNEAENIRVSPIKVDSIDLAECAEIYANISDASHPELPKQRKCQIVTLPNDAKLIVGSKAFMLENEYFKNVVSAQVKQPLKGPIVKVEQELQPVLALVDNHKNVSLLWRQKLGICCPAEITLVMSQIDAKGNIIFGHSYKAGGQPCD